MARVDRSPAQYRLQRYADVPTVSLQFLRANETWFRLLHGTEEECKAEFTRRAADLHEGHGAKLTEKAANGLRWGR